MKRVYDLEIVVKRTVYGGLDDRVFWGVYLDTINGYGKTGDTFPMAFKFLMADFGAATKRLGRVPGR